MKCLFENTKINIKEVGNGQLKMKWINCFVKNADVICTTVGIKTKMQGHGGGLVVSSAFLFDNPSSNPVEV